MSYIEVEGSALVDILGAVFAEGINSGGPGRVMIEINDSDYVRCEDFLFSRPWTDAITVTDSTYVVINDGTIRHPCRQADNTFDAVRVTSSDYCRITQLTIIPETGEDLPRYGINMVSGNNNIVVGNDLQAAADYGTAPLVDTATNTSLEWPDDVTYGDNWVL